MAAGKDKENTQVQNNTTGNSGNNADDKNKKKKSGGAGGLVGLALLLALLGFGGYGFGTGNGALGFLGEYNESLKKQDTSTDNDTKPETETTQTTENAQPEGKQDNTTVTEAEDGEQGISAVRISGEEILVDGKTVTLEELEEMITGFIVEQGTEIILENDKAIVNKYEEVREVLENHGYSVKEVDL